MLPCPSATPSLCIYAYRPTLFGGFLLRLQLTLFPVTYHLADNFLLICFSHHHQNHLSPQEQNIKSFHFLLESCLINHPLCCLGPVAPASTVLLSIDMVPSCHLGIAM